MPRATLHEHGGGAPHRSAVLPAHNATNAASLQQNTRPQQAATEYPEIPDSQGDSQDDIQYRREILDSQDDPADYLSSIAGADDLGGREPGPGDGSASLNQGEDLDGYETEEDPDPEGTRQAILSWFNNHDPNALAPTQVPSERSTVEVVKSKPPYVSSHPVLLLKS